MTTVATVILIALAEFVSVACLVALWRTRASRWRKLMWSPVVLVPVMGPLFYGGLFEVPSRQPEHLQASRTSGDDAGPHGP
jgi:hypothetical protein